MHWSAGPPPIIQGANRTFFAWVVLLGVRADLPDISHDLMALEAAVLPAELLAPAGALGAQQVIAARTLLQIAIVLNCVAGRTGESTQMI